MLSININDNNIHKPNEDKATGCPRFIVVTINPQLVVPNILPNLPLNPCSPKYSPINSSDIKRCIYGLSQLHTPEIRIPVNPLINHHILSEIIKIPADIAIIRFNIHRIKTMDRIFFGLYLSTIFPHIKALGIAVIIPVKMRYCICLSDKPIVSKIYNEVKVEAVYIAQEYQKRAIKNLANPGNSFMSFNVCFN